MQQVRLAIKLDPSLYDLHKPYRGSKGLQEALDVPRKVINSAMRLSDRRWQPNEQHRGESKFFIPSTAEEHTTQKAFREASFISVKIAPYTQEAIACVVQFRRRSVTYFELSLVYSLEGKFCGSVSSTRS